MEDNTNVIIRKSVPNTDTLIPDYTRGCKHLEADNRDKKYKDEDGTCVFSLCANVASLDFSHEKWDKISDYIDQHGRTNPVTKKDRIQSTCQPSGFFCYHDEADNYTAAPIDETLYKGEYCIFSACNRSNFDEYEKYLEFEEYLKTHPGEIRGIGTAKFCNNQQFLGCRDSSATNYDSKANVEDKSCEFAYCADRRYAEFDQSKVDVGQKYIDLHGQLLANGNNRVINTCATGLTYCLHPDAQEYKGANANPADYLNEFCTFSACTKTDFDGYAKFIEYTDYLKTHPGKINTDNSAASCQGQKIYGCAFSGADNYNPAVNIENGSCTFSYCADKRYDEFNQTKINSAKPYIDQHGANLSNGSSRVTNTCSTGKVYCLHPDAQEYRGSNVNPADYLTQFCTFSACTKPDFDGYEKFIEYTNYLKTHPGKISADNSAASCQGQKIYGCSFSAADNYNLQANIEDKSCVFSYCSDKRFEEFNQAEIDAAKPYIDQHGSNLSNGSSRINNTCSTEKIYCLHPEAKEFTSSNINIADYAREFCTLSACTKTNFQGYSKYLEFLEYLKTHTGTILTDNSPASCLREIVTTTKNVDPSFNESKFDKAYIDFIIDDSFSMDNEIEQVKDALKEVTDLLIDTRKDLELNFYKMSDMNREVNGVKDYYVLKNVTGNFRSYDINFLDPYASVSITSNSNITQVKNTIEQILRNTQTAAVYGEQGLCLTLRHMNDLVKKNRSPKEQSIVILLTDEDDHYKNDSRGCREEMTFWNGRHQNLQDIVFEDNQGNQVQIQSFLDLTETVNDPSSFKQAYGWLGFIYDENHHGCTTFEGNESHGETYLEFAKQLENHGIPSAIADICDESYAQVIEDKIINGFLEEVGYEYFLIDRQPDFELLKVRVELKNGSIVDVPNSEYVIVSRGGGKLFVAFTEVAGEQYVKKAKKLLFDYTYTK